MRTSLKTFLEGKEKEWEKMNWDWSWIAQTAKEAYELGRKEECKEWFEIVRRHLKCEESK